jgi:hypothetical protein
MGTPPKSNIGNAVGWLLAGIPIVDAFALGEYREVMVITFIAIVPLLRLWQRFIAAT